MVDVAKVRMFGQNIGTLFGMTLTELQDLNMTMI